MLGTPKPTRSKTLQSSAEEASAVRLLGPPFVIIAQYFFSLLLSFYTSLLRMADGASFHGKINKYSKEDDKENTLWGLKKTQKQIKTTNL